MHDLFRNVYKMGVVHVINYRKNAPRKNPHSLGPTMKRTIAQLHHDSHIDYLILISVLPHDCKVTHVNYMSQHWSHEFVLHLYHGSHTDQRYRQVNIRWRTCKGWFIVIEHGKSGEISLPFTAKRLETARTWKRRCWRNYCEWQIGYEQLVLTIGRL